MTTRREKAKRAVETAYQAFEVAVDAANDMFTRDELIDAAERLRNEIEFARSTGWSVDQLLSGTEQRLLKAWQAGYDGGHQVAHDIVKGGGSL